MVWYGMLDQTNKNNEEEGGSLLLASWFRTKRVDGANPRMVAHIVQTHQAEWAVYSHYSHKNELRFALFIFCSNTTFSLNHVVALVTKRKNKE